MNAISIYTIFNVLFCSLKILNTDYIHQLPSSNEASHQDLPMLSSSQLLFPCWSQILFTSCRNTGFLWVPDPMYIILYNLSLSILSFFLHRLQAVYKFLCTTKSIDLQTQWKREIGVVCAEWSSWTWNPLLAGPPFATKQRGWPILGVSNTRLRLWDFTIGEVWLRSVHSRSFTLCKKRP